MEYTMAFDPHLVPFAIVTVAVGYLMAVAGIEKSALEWKRRRRKCPACGRELERGVCSCTG
jgi:hypothetical protein